MLQIDDSGSGSFVGGTCIGVYRPETNEYFFDVIPVELYNKENIKKKLYLDAVVSIVSHAIESFKPEKGEIIEICRGYMFEKLKLWLEQNSYTWYSTQITGKIQTVVEKNFELYAENLGLPRHYINYTRYPFHFHKLLRWVYADYENRIKLCKVGWQCWQRLEGHEPEISFASMLSSSFSCLKCGRHIKPGSRIKVMKYTSNKENYIYLHCNC